MIAVSGIQLTFRLPHPGRQLAGVRLRQDVRIPGDLLDVEYLLELCRGDDSSELVPDPDNPMQVAGAFGILASITRYPSAGMLVAVSR